jgi:hypothetical protein
MNDLIPQPHTGFQPTKLSHTLDFGKFLSIEVIRDDLNSLNFHYSSCCGVLFPFSFFFFLPFFFDVMPRVNCDCFGGL